MKQHLLRVGIVGGAVMFAVLGLSFVQFSSAQTDSGASSTTSTVLSEATTSLSLDQSSSSTVITTSSDAISSSTPPVSTSSTASSSSSTSTPSSTPIAVTSTTSTQGSGSSTTPTSTDVSTTPAPSIPSLELLESSSPSSSTPLVLSLTTTTVSSTAPISPVPPAPVPTGYPTCDQSVKNVPADYPTIQAAINAASIGDTIKIAAGTYNEDLNLTSGICLEGAGIDQTIISKSGASGISGNNVSYVIIKGVTVQNSGCAPGVCGGGGNGGGIELSQSNNITMQSCRLTGNVAVDGGGMFLSQSSIAMDHCLVDGNIAYNAGGGMIMDAHSTATLTNVTVANNGWINPLGNGGIGGIQSDGSGLQISNSILWGNTGKNLSGSNSTVSNSDIGGWSGGANNVANNPGFVSTTDYHLQASSTKDMGSY